MNLNFNFIKNSVPAALFVCYKSKSIKDNVVEFYDWQLQMVHRTLNKLKLFV